MGSLGWHNPVPFELGGGETEVELIYQALRSAVGVGGSAEDEDGSIDGIWRQAKARGIAKASPAAQRAAFQAWPFLATDALDYYEKLFFLTPEPDATDEERRLASSTRYTATVRASVPELEADLLAIDPRFSIVDVPETQTETTHFGRAFEDLAATEPFGGGRKSTLFPNYSTEFVVYVLFGLSPGVAPNITEQRLIRLAKEHLNEVLPGWVNFQIVTKIGFVLDIDLLDLTGLSP